MNLPLQVVRSRVLVFSIGAERTHIARRIMYKAMPYHLVLAFEALSAFAAWTARDGAIMWAVLRMYVRMRAGVSG